MTKQFGIFFLFFLSVCLLPEKVHAQNTGQLPQFRMTLSNGRIYGVSDLPQNKPVVLIYFSPDCDHCHTLMNAFFKRADEFKQAVVVMVTFKPLNEVIAFERAFQTARYPHIVVGTEGATNYLRTFYKLQNTPFTALYSRQGKLVSSYRKETPVASLLEQLNVQ